MSFTSVETAMRMAIVEKKRKDGGDIIGTMTLRDFFAAQALTGAQIWDAILNGKESTQFAGSVEKLAEVAYAVADAMLKARKS